MDYTISFERSYELDSDTNNSLFLGGIASALSDDFISFLMNSEQGNSAELEAGAV
jgi:hypothetical protein